MSVIHILLTTLTSDVRSFVNMYYPLAMPFNLAFLILSHLSVVLGLAVSFIFHSRSKVHHNNLSGHRHELNLRFSLMAVSTFFVIVGFVA
jgi:hypothetical protein